MSVYRTIGPLVLYRNIYCVVLHVSYDLCPNRFIKLVDGATLRVNFRKIFKILLLRNRKADEAETWHTCKGYCPLQKLCFCSNRIRTLVAMATYSSLRPIMGKEENGNFFCLIGDILIFFFTEMFIE